MIFNIMDERRSVMFLFRFYLLLLLTIFVFLFSCAATITDFAERGNKVKVEEMLKKKADQ